jgi:hypothetical protein
LNKEKEKENGNKNENRHSKIQRKIEPGDRRYGHSGIRIRGWRMDFQ